MNENRNKEVKYLGFRLNQTSVIILFILSLTALIGYISTIYSYIIDSNFRFYFIVLMLIPFGFSCYTLIICLKMRSNHLNDDNEGLNWFGFENNNISATILNFMSIIGLIGFIPSFYSGVYTLIHIQDSFLDLPRILVVFIPAIYNLIGLIILGLIYIYTLKKCIVLKKSFRKERVISSNENRKDPKILGFTLNQTSAIIVFILVLNWIVSLISFMFSYLAQILSLFTPMFRSIFNLTGTISIDLFLSNLISYIFLLILLGFYIYSLLSCRNLKKYHLNNEINRIYWFGFEINKTSATILFLISSLGLFGFLITLFEFINDIIYIFDFVDILYPLHEYLLFPLVDLLQGIILFLIHIYTIRRCTKVKKQIK